MVHSVTNFKSDKERWLSNCSFSSSMLLAVCIIKSFFIGYDSLCFHIKHYRIHFLSILFVGKLPGTYILVFMKVL